MTDFDFTIQNYSLQDLRNFFKLSDSYSISELEKKENEIRTLLLSTGHISPYFTKDLIVFLNQAKQLLLEVIPITEPSKKEKSVYRSYPKDLSPPSRQENIITPQKTPYLYTQNSDYFEGTLNPLNTRTVKNSLSIDSRFRSLPSSSSDFTFSLPNKISHVLSLECNSFEIQPESIPTISSSLGNHFFYISVKTVENKVEKEYPHIFVLPNGHYSTKYLLYTLNRLFSEQEYSPFLMLEWVLDPYGSGKCILMLSKNPIDKPYTHQIKEINMNFMIDINGNEDLHTDHLSKLGRLLGFTKKQYTGKLLYMSETVPSPYLGMKYFYLCVDDFQNRSPTSFIQAFVKTSIHPSILARIVFTSEQTLQITSLPRKYFGPIDLSRFQIRIVDAYGKIMDLDHTDFSFSLQLDTVYDL